MDEPGSRRMGNAALRRAAGFGLAALFALAPHAVRAQTSPPPGADDDVITLRNGTVLRGRVAESVPGDSVRIVLSDGEVRRVVWDDVASARGPALDLPGGDNGPSPLLRPTPDRVPLRVESPARPLYLVEPLPGLTVTNARGRREHVWRQLCEVPCTLYVRPGVFVLNGSNTSDGSHGELWSGPVRAPGLRLQVWTAASLAEADWVREPAVRERREQLRAAMAAQDAWDRQSHHVQRVSQVMRGFGDAMMVTGGAALHMSLVLYLTTSPFDHCAQGLFAAGCDGPSAAVALLAGGLTSLASGAVLALLGSRDPHLPPRPESPATNVELPLEDQETAP